MGEGLLDLTGRIVVVSGAGGGGIGTTVTELAARCGATVLAVSRSRDNLDQHVAPLADQGLAVVPVVADAATDAGIATVLASSGDKSVAPLEAAICLGAVAASWLAIHAVYTMRYARHYYVNERGCVDFNNDDKPSLADFAYLAYCLGMTYQVSDTDLKTKGVRRIVFFHTLLSYVFGTGVIASTINLVIGMAQ